MQEKKTRQDNLGLLFTIIESVDFIIHFVNHTNPEKQPTFL